MTSWPDFHYHETVLGLLLPQDTKANSGGQGMVGGIKTGGWVRSLGLYV